MILWKDPWVVSLQIFHRKKLQVYNINEYIYNFLNFIIDAFSFLGTVNSAVADNYFESKFEDKVHIVHIVLGLFSLLEKEYHFQGISTLISGHHEEDDNFGLSLVLNAELLGFLYTGIYR